MQENHSMCVSKKEVKKIHDDGIIQLKYNVILWILLAIIANAITVGGSILYTGKWAGNIESEVKKNTESIKKHENSSLETLDLKDKYLFNEQIVNLSNRVGNLEKKIDILLQRS